MLARLTQVISAWHTCRRRWRGYLLDRRGATAIEYGLIASAIAVTIIAAVFALGDTIGEFFNGIGDKIDGAGK